MRGMLTRLAVLTLALGYCMSGAVASQGSGCMPTSGVVSGLTLVQDINAGIAALISSNSGATAPTTDCTAASIKGQLWLDTSATPNHMRVYDGANWLDLGAVDSVSHVWTPPIGGGSSSLASATTTDLCSSTNRYFSITGTTTINSFSNTCVVGEIKAMTFAGILTLTYNATSMILPTAADITTQVGDSLLALYLGGGNWRVMAYTRADGTALNTNAVIAGAISFTGVLTPTALSGNTNNWNPSNLAISTIIRISASSAVNLTGITAPVVSQDGRMLILQNVGTFNITLTSNDANSTAANRFNFPSPIIVRPGSALTIFYDHTSNLWRLGNPHTAQTIAGGFKNLAVANVATNSFSAPGTPNNQVTIAADEITVEDTNGAAVRLSSLNVTPDITASGANGLDTGSVASNTDYFIWVIYNPTTSTAAGMFSTSATAPTMPSGYTFKARVGWDHTAPAATTLTRFIQYGRRWQLVYTANNQSTGLLASGSATAWAAVSLTHFVPTTASRIFVVGGTQGTACYIQAAPNNNYNSASIGNSIPPIAFASPASSGGAQYAEMTIETAGTIYWGNNNASCILAYQGYEDNL